MKIGMVCYPTVGGSGAIAAELGLKLAARGHDVHFISYSVPFRLQGYSERVHYHVVEVSSYPLFKFPPYDLALAGKLMEVLEKVDLDLDHAHYAVPHAISAYLARQMLPSHPVKVITTLHGTDIVVVGNDRSYFQITRFGIEQSDGITAVSNYLARETRRQFQTEKPIRVIPNFVDTTRFAPIRDPDKRQHFARPDEKIVVHASNFRPIKRIPDAVNVFARISRRMPARFFLIGDGPELPRVATTAESLGVLDKVIFLGQQESVEELLGVADLFLLPSEFESFGLAALEALSCGVPVVATTAGGIPEVVDDGKNGFVCRIGDVERMAEHSIALLANPERWKSFAESARASAVERFPFDRIVDEYEKYYGEVLAAAPGPRSDTPSAKSAATSS